MRLTVSIYFPILCYTPGRIVLEKFHIVIVFKKYGNFYFDLIRRKKRVILNLSKVQYVIFSNHINVKVPIFNFWKWELLFYSSFLNLIPFFPISTLNCCSENCCIKVSSTTFIFRLQLSQVFLKSFEISVSIEVVNCFLMFYPSFDVTIISHINIVVKHIFNVFYCYMLWLMSYFV